MRDGSETAPVPDPPKFEAQERSRPSSARIYEYKALPAYSEPDWVTKQFVDTGKLPPVKDRLPKEPLVFKTGNMPDGIGAYGDVMRHVIGGRPEGWNYSAGQTQGWGGIDIGLSECLTRTGPLFEVEADDLEPLPNLAKSWDWAEDGKSLTDPPDRGRQMVGRRALRRRRPDVLLGRQRPRPERHAAERRQPGDLRRRHHARRRSTTPRSSSASPTPSRGR